VLSIKAEDVAKLFEEDARARKRLAELLVSEPDDALDKRMDYAARISWLLAGSFLAILVAQLIVHAITR
jgi:hypothetical protein